MQYQRNDKDCLQVCLSELLNIPYEYIPKFYEYYGDDSGLFSKKFDEWLKSLRLIRILVNVTIVDNSIVMPYVSMMPYRCLGILQKKDRPYSHCVLLRVESNMTYCEDPKPDSEYTLADITGIEIITGEFNYGTSSM